MTLAGIVAGFKSSLLQLVRQRKHVVVDLAVLALSFEFAYLLRFDFVIPARELPFALHQIWLVVLIQFVALRGAGIYRFMWRYIGLSDVKWFVMAACGSFLPLVVMRLALSENHRFQRVPLSVIIIDTVLAFGGILVVRVLRRIVYEKYQRPRLRNLRLETELKPILLIGAGHAGRMAAHEIQRLESGLEIKGFVDDDPIKQQALIQGYKVLGKTSDLPRLAKSLSIDHVVITIARASRQNLRRIVEICEQIPVKVRIIPSLHELLQGSVTVSRIRDVQIDDLLGRAPVHLEGEGRKRFFKGKTIMVTGAGGSIGSELARQIASYEPSNLLLVERAEFALFNIDRELRGAYGKLAITPVLADVGNQSRMKHVFATHRPQVVIHAAAHKHVPMIEANTTEAVVNNVLATYDLGELAGQWGVDVFVLISTDKAVRPTSVMGASKRLAEQSIQYLNQQYAARFVAVRFGNVIGSAGSVIPIFRAQIEKGGPITVTHPDMIRYFMTIPEASQLVLEAATLGEGGEIFVLDMGEPVRIVDLAKDMISLSGLTPYEDIEITFTGARPGEKMFEELEISEEKISKTRHPKIFMGKIAPCPTEIFAHALTQLEAAAARGDEEEIKRILNEVIPEARLTTKRDVRAEVMHVRAAGAAIGQRSF